MANIIGTNGNDTLVGSYDTDTIKGLAGNDTITANGGDDTVTGGGGKDKFVYTTTIDSSYGILTDGTDIITDFGGVGKGTNPTAAIIAEVDIIKFLGAGFTAQNLLLTQNGSNLEITFEGVADAKVILKDFKLENLENLKASGATPAIGNILFDGQTSITDSFNVLDANSTDTKLGIKNTVTFLNDLDNNITGLNDSDDVVNGQGGNDKIDGLSGNDLLRGGTGNDTLIGGTGNDTLVGDTGTNSLVGGTGDDNLNVNYSEGNNLLDGGDGNDYLSASGDYYYSARGGLSFRNPISGNNTLTGGAGDDNLNAKYSTGNNLLSGGAGNDNLSADYSIGNNLLSGGAGDDNLSVSGFTVGRFGDLYRSYGTGNNTLNGDAGDDTLDAGYTTGNNTLNGGIGDDYFNLDNSTGNNLLFGGDGNDLFYINTSYTAPSSLVTQTLDGGKGDDLLSVDYSRSSGGITTTFNATTNIGSITADTNRVNYNNIERLNIKGTAYDDNIVGNTGNDTLSTGNGGKDTIDGGKGDDVLSVDYGYSSGGITTTFNASTNIGAITAGTNRVNYKSIERLEIKGTGYDDNIVGNSGNDTLSGGYGGNDTIDGGKGDDYLSGGYSSGNQTFYGGFGNDYLTGGNGNDSLYGGSGTDTFTFDSYDGGVDSIYDFNATNELIKVLAYGFGGGLSSGSLKANQFIIGTSANTSVQRFIYNSATGELFFDQDGSASGFTQVKFAQLSGGLSLTENNFVAF